MRSLILQAFLLVLACSILSVQAGESHQDGQKVVTVQLVGEGRNQPVLVQVGHALEVRFEDGLDEVAGDWNVSSGPGAVIENRGTSLIVNTKDIGRTVISAPSKSGGHLSVIVVAYAPEHREYVEAVFGGKPLSPEIMRDMYEHPEKYGAY